MDFKKIKQLEEEIKALLEERPEYKEWFYEMRAEVDKIGNKNKANRCAVAIDVMMTKWLEIIEANEELQGRVNGEEPEKT